MNLIADMWRYAELCSHDKQDSGDGDSDKHDYIKDFISVKSPTTLFTQMSNDTEYCYIAEEEDRIVIPFRGTDGIKAWINDFNVLPLHDGYMHRGFYDLFYLFAQAIDRYFQYSFGLPAKDFSKCPKKVYINGHSLGGIMAQYCFRHLVKERNLNATCVSFGSPVGGTQKWKDELDSLPAKNIRVVNAYDLVTRLCDNIGKHAGELTWLPGPAWHKLLRVRMAYDHAYSQYTKGLITYCESINDKEGVEAMKTVLKRCTI